MDFLKTWISLFRRFLNFLRGLKIIVFVCSIYCVENVRLEVGRMFEKFFTQNIFINLVKCDLKRCCGFFKNMD